MNFKFDHISAHLEMVPIVLRDSFDSSFVVHQDVLGLHVKGYSQKQQDMDNKYECLHFESTMDKIYNHYDIGIHLMVYDI